MQQQYIECGIDISFLGKATAHIHISYNSGNLSYIMYLYNSISSILKTNDLPNLEARMKGDTPIGGRGIRFKDVGRRTTISLDSAMEATSKVNQIIRPHMPFSNRNG
jgi:hypothetical protein